MGFSLHVLIGLCMCDDIQLQTRALPVKVPVLAGYREELYQTLFQVSDLSLRVTIELTIQLNI